MQPGAEHQRVLVSSISLTQYYLSHCNWLFT